MKKILLILLCLPVLYSCQFNKVEVYEKKHVIDVDTINIEQIKIQTH